MSAAEIATHPAVGVRRWPRKVEEDRAAAALGPPGEILVEHESHIVKMILAPHLVGAVARRQAHRAIVARAQGVLAPALVAPQGPERAARRSRAARGPAGNSPISSRNRPAGVPLSPSRLMRTIPAGPSAHGMRKDRPSASRAPGFPQAGGHAIVRGVGSSSLRYPSTDGSAKSQARRRASPHSRYAHGYCSPLANLIFARRGRPRSRLLSC